MSKQDKSGRQVCIAFAQFTSTYFATRCLKMVQVRRRAASHPFGLPLCRRMPHSQGKCLLVHAMILLQVLCRHLCVILITGSYVYGAL